MRDGSAWHYSTRASVHSPLRAKRVKEGHRDFLAQQERVTKRKTERGFANIQNTERG